MLISQRQKATVIVSRGEGETETDQTLLRCGGTRQKEHLADMLHCRTHSPHRTE